MVRGRSWKTNRNNTKCIIGGATMKKVEIKLIVDVDVTDEMVCPSGDHLEENCLLNAVNNDFFMDNVEILTVQEVK